MVQPYQSPNYGWNNGGMTYNGWNPNQVPMYGQVQQPMQYQSMYLPQQNQQQNQMQQQQIPISGRFVSDEKEIMPEEVPMNNTMMFFPMTDGSCVYGKYWTHDAQFKTVKFLPSTESNDQTLNQNSEVSTTILERIGKIEKMLTNVMASLGYEEKEGNNV